MKSQGELRSWLLAHGYCVEQERVLWEEGHWYTLLKVTGGAAEDTLTPGALEAGLPARWCREDDWLGYLKYMEQRLTRQKTGLEQSAAGGDPVRLAYLKAALAEFAAWRALLERGVWPE